MMSVIHKIWSLFDSKQRRYALSLFVATLVGSILEAFGIGLIIPLIKLLSDPSAIQGYPWLLRISKFFGYTSSRDVLFLFIGAYTIFFIFKSIYVIKLAYFQLRFVSEILHSISCRLLKVYLKSPWVFHLNRNSAELLNNIVSQAGVLCTGLINSVISLSTEFLITLAVTVLLLFVNFLSTVIAMLLLGVTSILFIYISHRKLEYYGAENQRFSAAMIKSVNESFGGIKEVKVLGREDYFIRAYSENNRGYTRSWIFNTMVSQYQRSFVELLFIGGILIVSIYAIYSGKAGIGIFSTLALFAAAAFRLMPAINRMNTALGSIKYYKPVLDNIHLDINLTVEEENNTASDGRMAVEPVIFERCIELQNVTFRYADTQKDVLSSVSISIPKGYAVGFIGPSGAGKTTVVDIILGLIKPVSGKVLVDDRDIFKNTIAWQKKVGYIPQNIYLSDNSIRCNVAFGVYDDEIDDNRVWSALKDAQLHDFVNELPNGLNTMVGERGVRLSGGQRQRIGIARALYHNPQVLVMDEATSSLDSETEKEIADAIDRLAGEKTLIIIAHRLTTVEKCDILYEVNNGNIIEKKRVSYRKSVASE